MGEPYSPTDFGYNFASTEPDERAALVVADPTNNNKNRSKINSKINSKSKSKSKSDLPSRPVGIEGSRNTGYELYDDQQQQQRVEEKQRERDQPYRYQPAKINRGGESYFVSPDSHHLGGADINPIGFLGAICCCFTVVFVVVGGFLLAYNRYQTSEDPLLLVGSLCLVVGAGACLCGCCALCVGGTASSASLLGGGGSSSSSSSSSKVDPLFHEVEVRFRRLNDRYEKGCLVAEDGLRNVRLDVVGHMKEVKDAARKEAKQKMEKEKKDREELERRVKRDLEEGISVGEIRKRYRPVVFYIVFDGDVMVSNLELLRKQVSLVVNLGQPGHDRCVVTINSPGGAVSQYGLAASQLVRIRKAGIHLTCCIDTVAASGGYMMASVANTICAAPFAVVGSIGVVTHVPNFQRFLNEHKIDAYLMTAGEHKRTIDVIGEVTEENKAKMKEQLEDIHTAFKDHVALARPQLRDAMETVGTGEHWLAVQAKEKGLVDEIRTSDEYLESVCETHDIIEILEKVYKPRGLSGLMVEDSLATAGKSLMGWVINRFQSGAASGGQPPLPMASMV
eukprot:CAMPEP_0172387492 /NCGR_PEP_ID=MMETSP1061-20121228/4788_1 /TAXON_ID=37318 /ORGANISM="Pseudo-nitzschia pungens, Strain cf. pungens" /LENGTH=563 /DNA_ID=CAMNT_0013117143 /DNA_START=241 /DNA_END=1932 /DNA_ORIENTATION=+